MLNLFHLWEYFIKGMFLKVAFIDETSRITVNHKYGSLSFLYHFSVQRHLNESSICISENFIQLQLVSDWMPQTPDYEINIKKRCYKLKLKYYLSYYIRKRMTFINFVNVPTFWFELRFYLARCRRYMKGFPDLHWRFQTRPNE